MQSKSACADFTCDGVKEHEVLKVGDFSPLPSLRHVGRLEELTRRRQGDTSEMQTHEIDLSIMWKRGVLRLWSYLACGNP